MKRNPDTRASGPPGLGERTEPASWLGLSRAARTCLGPALLFAASLWLASAATAGGVGQPGAGSAPAASPARADDVEAYGEADATCQEWGDACRICQRTAAPNGASPGDWTCSTPGIACLPEAVSCRRR